MKIHPAVSVIVLLGLSSLPLGSVQAQWFDRMQKLRPTQMVRPTGFSAPLKLQSRGFECRPEPAAANEDAVRAGDRRRRFVNCLLHVHERQLNRMELMLKKLESRRDKLKATGKDISKLEDRIRQMRSALTSARTQFTATQTAFKNLDLTGEVAPLRQQIKDQMQDLLEAMKKIHTATSDAVRDIKSSPLDHMPPRAWYRMEDK